MPSAGICTPRPPGQERRFSVDLVGEVVRNFTLTLWNVYSFFVTYANLDNWSPAGQDPILTYSFSDLDRWMLSELHALVRDVTTALETYDVTGATRPIQVFVDILSNGISAARAAAFGKASRTPIRTPLMPHSMRRWLP